jgi:hypothetical protein
VAGLETCGTGSRFMESSLFHFGLLTGHEPVLMPERELSHCQAEVRLAALRHATPLGRFSARANIRAAVWDKPRSDCALGVSRFMEGSLARRPTLPRGARFIFFGDNW